MSNSNPPQPVARHLRLVPPLPEQMPHGSEANGATGEANAAIKRTLASARTAVQDAHLPWVWHLPAPANKPWAMAAHLPWGVRWALAAAAGTALTLLFAPFGLDLPGRHAGALGAAQPQRTAAVSHNARAVPPGPSIQLYAKGVEGAVFGRALHDGDPLYPHDHLVLGIHNAPAAGFEAAQFAAVFAMDEARNIAALYPALGPDAVAMPLPQVASMALLDGPQISGATGPVTLVAVFLRQQVALGALMDALRAAPATQAVATLDAGPGAELGAALRPALLRLQQVTLTHGAAKSP